MQDNKFEPTTSHLFIFILTYINGDKYILMIFYNEYYSLNVQID